MEVLRVQSIPQIDQIVPSPPTEPSTPLVHRVSARLCKIPSVPTTIKVPEQTEPESFTRTSSLRNSLTSKASQSSSANSVATSILLVPSQFLTSKIHVAPSMHIGEDLVSLWDQRVRITLSEILLREITTGSCIQELMMAGKDPFQLKPTIIVTCGNSKTQKLVKKAFMKESWLKALLKEKGMGLVAVVQPVHLSSSPATTLVTITTAATTVNMTFAASSSTVAPSRVSKSQNNIALIAALATVLPLVIIGAVIGFMCVRRRRARRSKVRRQPEMSSLAKYLYTSIRSPDSPGLELHVSHPILGAVKFPADQSSIGRTVSDTLNTNPAQNRDASSLGAALECFTYIDVVLDAPCGQRIYVNRAEASIGHSCTLGGLILVDNELFVLSAGHPFASSIFTSEATDLSSSSTKTSEIDVTHANNDSHQQPDPFWFDSDSDTESETHSDIDNQVNIGDPITNLEDIRSCQPLTRIPRLSDDTLTRRVNLQIAYASHQPLDTAQRMLKIEKSRSDWALLTSHEVPRSISNKVTILKQGRSDYMVSTTITEFADTAIQGDVHVLYGSDPRSGHLCASTSTIQVDGKAYDVKLVILEEKLPPGCSGSWVVAGRTLCGHIISAREDVPWAYMLSIQSILQDIKRVCNTDDVRLPSIEEIQNRTDEPAVEVTPTRHRVNSPSAEAWDQKILGTRPSYPGETHTRISSARRFISRYLSILSIKSSRDEEHPVYLNQPQFHLPGPVDLSLRDSEVHFMDGYSAGLSNLQLTTSRPRNLTLRHASSYVPRFFNAHRHSSTSSKHLVHNDRHLPDPNSYWI